MVRTGIDPVAHICENRGGHLQCTLLAGLFRRPKVVCCVVMVVERSAMFDFDGDDQGMLEEQDGLENAAKCGVRGHRIRKGRRSCVWAEK